MDDKRRESLKRARDLYRNRGILNEDAIRADVIKSWERSKLFQKLSESFGTLDRELAGDDKKSERAQNLFENILKSHSNLLGLYLVNGEGKVQEYATTELRFSGILDWSEHQMGTTAYCFCSESKRKSTVTSWEHYLPLFDDVVTMAMPMAVFGELEAYEYIVAILSEIETIEPDHEIWIDAFRRTYNAPSIEDVKQNRCGFMSVKNDHKQFENIEFSNFNTHLIAGISREIIDFKTSILKLSAQYNYVRIKAETVNEALSVVGYYVNECEKEYGRKLDISMVSEMKMTNHTQENAFDIEAFDVLIVVGLHRLTYGQQRQILKTLHLKDYAADGTEKSPENLRKIYLIETFDDGADSEPWIIDGLKVLLMAPKVELVPIRYRRQDIPMVIKTLEAELCQDKFEHLNVAERSLSQHPQLKYWQKSADDLSRWVIFNHHHEVVLEAHPDKSAVKDKTDVVYSPEPVSSAVDGLSKREKMEIDRALLVYKGNVNKTAKALGIARSTLYRKIEKYQIELRHLKV